MPHSVLLGRPWPQPGEPLFLQEDTDLAVALQEQEAAEESARCQHCGLPREVCRDPANQFMFQADAEQCHATYAIRVAQGDSPPDAADKAKSWSASLRH